MTDPSDRTSIGLHTECMAASRAPCFDPQEEDWYAYLSGMGPIPVRPGSVSTGINPMRRGPASLEGPPSLLSQRPKWSVVRECPSSASIPTNPDHARHALP